MPGRKAPEVARREQILKAAYDVALRRGLDGVTMRAVAARAKLSHGLVHFHFKRKTQLVIALLDWVLTTTTVLQIPADITRLPRAHARFRALLRQEMDRLSHEPRRTRLFFEYWVLGTRHAAIRTRIRAELERYRTAFRAMTAEMVRTDQAGGPAMTPDGLAAVAVSFINGCAVQAMIDPDHFDIVEYLASVEGMIGRAKWADREEPTVPAAVGQPRASAVRPVRDRRSATES